MFNRMRLGVAMVRSLSFVKLLGLRLRLASLLVWRQWKPLPEETTQQALAAQRSQAAWNDRCLAVAAYHWAVVQAQASQDQGIVPSNPAGAGR
jgi:hypothetical protein